jgi:hypothetical protein
MAQTTLYEYGIIANESYEPTSAHQLPENIIPYDTGDLKGTPVYNSN